MIVRPATPADIRAVLNNLTTAGRAEHLARQPFDDMAPVIERLIFASRASALIAQWALCPLAADRPAGLLGAWWESPRVAVLHGAITPEMLGFERGWGLVFLRRFMPLLAYSARLVTMSVMLEGQGVWLETLNRMGFAPHGAPLPYGRSGELFQDLVWRNPAIDGAAGGLSCLSCAPATRQAANV